MPESSVSASFPIGKKERKKEVNAVNHWECKVTVGQVYSCCGNRRSLARHRSTYHIAPCSLSLDTVIISADLDDIQTVLFLLSASVSPCFRPLPDKSHNLQQTGWCWGNCIHQHGVGREVTNCAAPYTKRNIYLQLWLLCCTRALPQFFLVCRDHSAELLCKCLCFVERNRDREPWWIN